MTSPRGFPVLISLLALLLAGAGCTSKAKARQTAARAFHAGQASEAQVQEARRNGITFTGPVLNPMVPWTEGLTLAQAIVAARWSGLHDPRLVVVTRAGERVELTLGQSLAAAELPLEPGDQIELLP